MTEAEWRAKTYTRCCGSCVAKSAIGDCDSSPADDGRGAEGTVGAQEPHHTQPVGRTGHGRGTEGTGGASVTPITRRAGYRSDRSGHEGTPKGAAWVRDHEVTQSAASHNDAGRE